MLADEIGAVDIIVEATGFSPLAFDAMDMVAPNGIVCLTGVSGGHENWKCRRTTSTWRWCYRTRLSSVPSSPTVATSSQASVTRKRSRPAGQRLERSLGHVNLIVENSVAGRIAR